MCLSVRRCQTFKGRRQGSILEGASKFFFKGIILNQPQTKQIKSKQEGICIRICAQPVRPRFLNREYPMFLEHVTTTCGGLIPQDSCQDFLILFLFRINTQPFGDLAPKWADPPRAQKRQRPQGPFSHTPNCSPKGPIDTRHLPSAVNP